MASIPLPAWEVADGGGEQLDSVFFEPLAFAGGSKVVPGHPRALNVQPYALCEGPVSLRPILRRRGYS